jgi:hypothetical protein
MNLLFNNNIDPYFWKNAMLPENAFKFQGWIYGVLGAVIAGWGTLIAFWAYYPFKMRELWAWNGLASATVIWYVADTALSAIYGVMFNIVFNTIILFLLGLPLIFTKKAFSQN